MTETSTTDASSADPRFEELLAVLEEVVQRLELGEQPLEEALADFERGVEIARKADGILETAEARVEQLLANRDGEEREEPFDAPF